MAEMSCVSAKIVNVSPEATIPPLQDFKTIAASIKVTCSDPLSSAHEDVAAALTEERVFQSVIVTTSEALFPDAELMVSPKIIDDSHFGAESGKAVFRGLLLGLADGAFADRYDYTVTLWASLEKGPRIIGEYEAVGKYYAQQPENRNAPQASETRRLAWEHALKLLVSKIKADRENIVSGLELNDR
jgi:hypothetical protein